MAFLQGPYIVIVNNTNILSVAIEYEQVYLCTESGFVIQRHFFRSKIDYADWSILFYIFVFLIFFYLFFICDISDII